MRRTLVGFPDKELAALDALSGIQHISRAELIRQAVALYIEKFKPADSAEEAFGLWRCVSRQISSCRMQLFGHLRRSATAFS